MLTFAEELVLLGLDEEGEFLPVSEPTMEGSVAKFFRIGELSALGGVRSWRMNDFKGRHFGGEIVLWAVRCVFHAMPVSDSTGSRSSIPWHPGHSFHAMPVSDSTPSRSLLTGS